MIDIQLLKTRASSPVEFTRFFDGCLWYKAVDGWEFPISTKETANSQGDTPTFHAKEKGIILMRWMRLAMEAETREKAAIEKAKSEKDGGYMNWDK